MSGKVSRKVSLPEPLQELSHRATLGRMHASGASPSNGARCGIVFLCVKVCISSRACVLTVLKEPRHSPQEFPSANGKHLPQPDSQDQMAVAGEKDH